MENTELFFFPEEENIELFLNNIYHIYNIYESFTYTNSIVNVCGFYIPSMWLKL
jgi:hypothetical protein